MEWGRGRGHTGCKGVKAWTGPLCCSVPCWWISPAHHLFPPSPEVLPTSTPLVTVALGWSSHTHLSLARATGTTFTWSHLIHKLCPKPHPGPEVLSLTPSFSYSHIQTLACSCYLALSSGSPALLNPTLHPATAQTPVWSTSSHKDTHGPCSARFLQW